MKLEGLKRCTLHLKRLRPGDIVDLASLMCFKVQSLGSYLSVKRGTKRHRGTCSGLVKTGREGR